jgi:excinuclease ABC subunit C
MFSIDTASLPLDSGVYIFKDQENNFLYIGKAKNLKKRIASYFTDRQVDWKLELLLKKAVSVDTIITQSEKEALLLEADLISTHKPIFNRLLTSSAPFTYIVYDSLDADMPTISLTRAPEKDLGQLIIGPFLTKKEAWKLYTNIIDFFQLGICNKKIVGGCLHFHIGKCAGFCRSDFDKKAYKERFLLSRKLCSDRVMFEQSIEQEIEKSIASFAFDRVEELERYKNQYRGYFGSLFEKDDDVKKRIEDILLDVSLKEEIIQKALLAIKDLFYFSYIPKTVDCIDISHFQGHAVVGSCVRFAGGRFSKKESRSYKMPEEINNDYRHLCSLVEIHYKGSGIDYPDLLVIDGGKGQLSAIEKMNIPTQIVALAKREETLYFVDRRRPVVLSLHDPLGLFFISLRNTAHHIAIGSHGRLFSKII